MYVTNISDCLYVKNSFSWFMETKNLGVSMVSTNIKYIRCDSAVLISFKVHSLLTIKRM